MSIARKLAALYVVLFALTVTWPGFLLFNRPTPLVLGLPFNLFVLAVLVSAGVVALFFLYLSEEQKQ